MNNYFFEDKQDIVNYALSLGFKNKSFLISGATGMIGRCLIGALSEITCEEKVIVMGKDAKEAEEVFCDRNFRITDFEHLTEIDDQIDCIIHLASPTNSKFLSECPVETIDFIYSSTKKMLDLALKKGSKLIFVSSMETYGQVFDENKRTEDDLGLVSLKTTRSSYPEAKRLSELLCLSYAKEYGLDVFVARLAQTFGAGTSLDDPRIFGYFARCVKNKENIILKTKGDSIGNYCYISDVLKAFFAIFTNGEKGATYNVVGDDNRSTILDMAKMVASEIAHGEIEVQFDLTDNGIYPSPTKLNMDNGLLKSLGWAPTYNLKDMFIRMIG